MWLCWVTGSLLLVHENLNISLWNNDVKHRWLSIGRRFLRPHTAEQRGPGNRPIFMSHWDDLVLTWESEALFFLHKFRGRRVSLLGSVQLDHPSEDSVTWVGWGRAVVPSTTIWCPRWEGLALCYSPSRGWTRAIKPQGQFWHELPFSFLWSESVWGLRCSKDMGLSSQRARRRWDGWVAVWFPDLLPGQLPKRLRLWRGSDSGVWGSGTGRPSRFRGLWPPASGVGGEWSRAKGRYQYAVWVSFHRGSRGWACI